MAGRSRRLYDAGSPEKRVLGAPVPASDIQDDGVRAGKSRHPAREVQIAPAVRAGGGPRHPAAIFAGQQTGVQDPGVQNGAYCGRWAGPLGGQFVENPAKTPQVAHTQEEGVPPAGRGGHDGDAGCPEGQSSECAERMGV